MYETGQFGLLLHKRQSCEPQYVSMVHLWRNFGVVQTKHGLRPETVSFAMYSRHTHVLWQKTREPAATGDLHGQKIIRDHKIIRLIWTPPFGSRLGGNGFRGRTQRFHNSRFQKIHCIKGGGRSHIDDCRGSCKRTAQEISIWKNILHPRQFKNPGRAENPMRLAQSTLENWKGTLPPPSSKRSNGKGKAMGPLEKGVYHVAVCKSGVCLICID